MKYVLINGTRDFCAEPLQPAPCLLRSLHESRQGFCKRVARGEVADRHERREVPRRDLRMRNLEREAPPSAGLVEQRAERLALHAYEARVVCPLRLRIVPLVRAPLCVGKWSWAEP